jgi:hypothetical protein
MGQAFGGRSAPNAARAYQARHRSSTYPKPPDPEAPDTTPRIEPNALTLSDR